MTRFTLCITLFASFLFISPPVATAGDEAVQLYYVRHAESLGNATKIHSSYNDRTLSAKGERQVKELTRKLAAYHFDYIIVSPKQRALKTILPYLKKHGRVAEIWPELDECCWQKKKHDLSSFQLAQGKRIRLESDMAPYFIFPHSEHRYNARNYAEGMFQLFKATDLIQRRFSGSGKNILVIGHYHAGSRIFEILQGFEPEGRYKLRNAKINHLKEGADGLFKVVSFDQ